nr:MAG TPA: hypothetical protein [Caudoviricetes sp.]
MAINRKYSSGADGVLLNDRDLDEIRKYGQAWNEASQRGDKAGMQAAHDAAEAIRGRYNYSGGSAGNEYIGLGKKNQSNIAGRPTKVNTEKFTYESAPSYTSKYQGEIDDLLDSILNRKDFSYDPDTDPLYASYQKQYTREGQRANADAMGQAAAMTGGMPSTAAVAAGQQAGNYYAAKMADKIPELQQLAYSMYRDEGDNMRLNMEMLTALEQGDYNKYLNALNQYNTDRNFAYGTFQDQRNYEYQLDRDYADDLRYDQEWNYGVGRDQVNDSRYDREWQHQLDREAIEDQRYQQEWDYQVQQDALARAAREVRSRRSGGEDYEEEDRDKEASGEETDVPVDRNSVIQLGYGPVSDEYLLQLEAAGEIESYVEGGKRKFRKKEGGRSGGFVIPGLDSMLGVR